LHLSHPDAPPDFALGSRDIARRVKAVNVKARDEIG
jgi:hypothetical protein